MPKRASLIDRALGAVGLQRRPQAPATRSYAAAQVNRLTGDWFTQILSADQELKGDLRRLRGASRSLVRDWSYASRYTHMVAENVIGPAGIRLQSQVGTTRGGTNTPLNQKIEAAWKRWGAPECASADGRLSWVELQQLIARTLPQDGEVLLRLVRGADNAFGFALQMLDADQLDETYCTVARGTGNEVRMGVEVDAFGKPVAYHLWTAHPSETGVARRRERVPADEIVHLYRVLRPGQTRGVPWFAPVLLDQKMLQAYQEAEVTAARVSASNVAAVVIPDVDKFEAGGGDRMEAAQNGGLPMDVQPGDWLRLRPGEAIQSTDFGHPNAEFGAFTKNILRSFAAGGNVSYMSLSGDMSDANYSSMRGGLLAERDAWRTLQEWVACHLHRRVFAAWLPMASLYGHLPAASVGDGAAVVDAARWLPRGWAWVDPLKDSDAAAQNIANGFTTRTAICAEQGEDFEENLARLAEEQRLAAEYGVVFPAPQGAPRPGGYASDAPAPPPTAEGAPARALRLTRALHA